jgi:hypothetical protein
MSKKKVTAKEPAPKASRPAKIVSSEQTALKTKSAANAAKTKPQSAETHVYRHEIDGNPNNAPLIVDIPIAEGRGENPPRPTFVGFTAEMSEEHWPDQFAFRVISLDARTVRVMISRVDKGSPELGWGVRLVVQVLVVAPSGS